MQKNYSGNKRFTLCSSFLRFTVIDWLASYAIITLVLVKIITKTMIKVISLNFKHIE